ncbi:hypothetical protein CFC21_049787 [Triticum aestivum]|uniref:Glutaredoxin domain-containing protein n=4 Tax=Triticinae TaxID=1648030 RepID=A0A9R1G3J7_WHEAT|nr:putative glutaredoxin-C2 [Aegilops tauschii subsp. strangulata]XP_044354000.1 putative glutaredoxin-C2 [Triticum aestivum]XP_044354001.1 putative glutaredoxin-C2 [Triticum aestivum]KAF7039839.1 hypothetical protein CFC21_049785 [Triticum aestivum]KAF7039841.1 hypothetical protein CFC21_049787 [Triticum aestivum]
MAERVTAMASQGIVVIFGASYCCMSHTMTGLFAQLGVSSTVHEVDKDPQRKDLERALAGMVGQSPAVPAVFIRGALVGGTRQVMELHLGGHLVPLLRQAGAL